MELFVVIIVIAFALTLIILDRRRFDRELAGERHRGDDLLDRLMSRSHESYKAIEQAEINTPPFPSEPAGRWVHDPMGLNTVFVPAGEAD